MSEQETQTEEVKSEQDTVKEIEDALYPTDKAEEDSKESADKEPATSEDESKEEDSVTDVVDTENKADETEKEGSETDFELKIKDEWTLDEAWAKDVKAWAKENKLTQEQAQTVLDKQEEAVSAYIKSNEDQWNTTLDNWRDEVISDPDMGGDNLKSTTENARRVVEKYGDENFINILKETGYGDNPHVVRFLAKLGGLMSEDSLILPGRESKEKPIEDYFYKTN